MNLYTLNFYLLFIPPWPLIIRLDGASAGFSSLIFAIPVAVARSFPPPEVDTRKFFKSQLLRLVLH